MSSGECQRKRRLQRKLARQVKGSNRRKVTKQAIAKLAAKETDRRKDWEAPPFRAERMSPLGNCNLHPLYVTNPTSYSDRYIDA